MPRQMTLAKELEGAPNTYLLKHYRDKRRNHIRHKIKIGVVGAALYPDREINPTEITEAVHKYIPEAQQYGFPGKFFIEFVWEQPFNSPPKPVGTDFYTKRRKEVSNVTS